MTEHLPLPPRAPPKSDAERWSRFLSSIIKNHATLQDGSSLILSAPDSPRRTRLSRHEEETLDQYLASGVDIDQPCLPNGVFEVPPLFKAVSQRCLPVINALLDRGASVSLVTIVDRGSGANRVPRTPLTWGLLESRSDIALDQDILNALIEATAARSPKHLHVTDEFGLTPLSLSVMFRNVFLRDALMKHGADPAHVDGDGQTLLHLLANHMAKSGINPNEEEAWLNWVLDQGVLPETLDATGNTARETAVMTRGNPGDGFVSIFDRVLAQRQANHLHLKTSQAAAPPRTHRL